MCKTNLSPAHAGAAPGKSSLCPIVAELRGKTRQMTRVRRVFLLIDGLRKTMQRRLLILALGLAVVAASWFALQSVAAWRLRFELRLAARDFAARRISDAKARLTHLAKRWPGQGEVEFWLGVCEMAEGHPDAAMAAWERVPDDAAEAPRVALSRGRVALETGRYGMAESVLDRVKQALGEVGNEARRLLGWVSWMTGRYDEYRRLLHRVADGQVDPSQTLRLAVESR